jgi:hypothetical protein
MPPKSPEAIAKDKERRKIRRAQHREEENERQRANYAKHRDEYLQQMKEYHQRTYAQRRDKKNQQTRERRLATNWYKRNRVTQKANARRYYEAHREEQRAKQNARTAAMRLEVLQHYGGKCACCGETEVKFLGIDHINNDGAAHRKAIGGGGNTTYRWLIKHGYPPGFQVLCHNCNLAKGFYGVCPHQERQDNLGPY